MKHKPTNNSKKWNEEFMMTNDYKTKFTSTTQFKNIYTQVGVLKQIKEANQQILTSAGKLEITFY